MKRILLLIASMALMLASSQWASAQSRSVKVNVQDSWGPVAGASVLIKGTTTGDVTDLDGNATITNIEESSVLVISFIGYTSQEGNSSGETNPDQCGNERRHRTP